MATGMALVARRRIRAAPGRVFAAWTEPEPLRAWWGPRPATCSDAEVGLRVGGRFRIVNALPDGGTVIIHGEFRVVGCRASSSTPGARETAARSRLW